MSEYDERPHTKRSGRLLSCCWTTGAAGCPGRSPGASLHGGTGLDTRQEERIQVMKHELRTVLQMDRPGGGLPVEADRWHLRLEKRTEDVGLRRDHEVEQPASRNARTDKGTSWNSHQTGWLRTSGGRSR